MGIGAIARLHNARSPSLLLLVLSSKVVENLFKGRLTQGVLAYV